MNLPLELTAMMSEAASRRNQALVEFNRINLDKLKNLHAKYEEQGQVEAATVVANKMIELRKEIERLKKAFVGAFVLLEADYGSSERSVDCLELLLGQVRENGLRITVKPAAVGLDKDPHFGVRKTLTVKYLCNDEVRTATAQDGQLLVVPEI